MNAGRMTKRILCCATAVLLAVALIAALSGCSVSGVYRYDDAKKNYDKGYRPAEKDPLALTEDEILAIKTAAADKWNQEQLVLYTEAMEAYNEAVIADALASAADASASAEASKAGSEYISTYKPAELEEPEEPDQKTVEDVAFYDYGGTYGGYVAVRYQIKDKAVVTAHQPENLVEDIIGNYNFSTYPDSPHMRLYKDGAFYTIREVYEAGGISDTDLKDIWYYFYVLSEQ